MTEQADIILMGLGTGGEDFALRLLGGGLSVIGIEPQLVGGECAYWACVPTKMMIRAANLIASARRVNGVAGNADVQPHWAPVAKRIREEATGDWNDSAAVARFEGKGGRFVRGWGRLTGPKTVTVDGKSFTATRGVVIATGSEPLVPPIPGLADVAYWVTHDLIKADTLPATMMVLGGGAVGCELSQVCARFGVKVTIVERADRLLPAEEPEASEVIAGAFRDEGIDLRLGGGAERVDTDGDRIVVTLASGERISAERVLVAAGRTVDLEPLGLAAAGIDGSSGFIDVDEHMRAGDGIWALGDVTGKAMFTHMALHQAGIVASDILGDGSRKASYHAVPRVAFTDPEVGAVGMSEAEARAAGIDVAVMVKQVPATFRGWIHGTANDGVIKLIADKSAGTLVGATVVGPSGGEVIGLLSTAIHARLPLSMLRSMIWAYPTFYGGIGEAIGAYALGIGKVVDPGTDPLLMP